MKCFFFLDLAHDENIVQKESPLAAPKTAHSFVTKPAGQNPLFWPHPLQNTKVNESEESFHHFSKSETSQEEHIVPFSLTAGYNLKSMLIESSNFYKETLSSPDQPIRNHTFTYTSPGDILPTVEHSEKHVITSNFTAPGDFLPNSIPKENPAYNNELYSTIRSKNKIYFLEDEENSKESLENTKKEDKENETPQRKHGYTEPCMMHNSENGSPQASLDPPTQQDKPTEVSDDANTSSKEEEVEHKPSEELDPETKKSPYSKPQIPRVPETFGIGLGGGQRFIRRDPYQSPRSAYYHKKELEKSRASYERFERYANTRGARSSGGQRGGPYDGPGGGPFGGPRGGTFDGSGGGAYGGPRGGPPGGSRGGPHGGHRGGPPFSAGNGEENWGRSRYIEPPPSAVVVRLDKYGHEIKKNEDGTITLTEPTPEYKTFSLGIEGKFIE